MTKTKLADLAILLGLVIGILWISISGSRAAQTKVNEGQLALKVRVIEHLKCNYTSPDGKVSCVGMEQIRLVMSDGSVKGPYILTPVGPDYKHDPSKWEVISEFK